MMFWRKLRDRFRSTRHRETVAGEIHDELRFHHDRLTDQLVGEGLTRDQALAEARRRIGNLPLAQDAGYDVRGGGWIETTVQDVKYGLRRLRRQPAFTAVAVLTLALGIGATTAIFSVANGLLLRPLPYPQADRLAMVWMDNSRIGLREDWFSYPDYDDYRTRNTTFQDLAIFNVTSRTFAGAGEPERVQGAHSTPNLFTVLGVPPFRGRTFTDAENVPGANNVVVISHGFWTRRFAAKDEALESTVQVNGRAMRIIGVMPPGFDFPAKDTDFWVPTAPNEQQRGARGSFWLQSVGRLKPGVPVDQAQADLARINSDIVTRFPQQTRIRRLRRGLPGAGRRPGTHRGARAAGRGGLRAADCVHERRQSAAGARLHARTRDGAARGDRRRPPAAGAPACDRERPAWMRGWRRRNRARVDRLEDPARSGARRSAARGQHSHGYDGARVCRRAVRPHRSRIRHAAGASGGRARSESDVA